MKVETFGSKKEIVKYPDLCAAVGVVLDTTAFATIAAANGGDVPAGTFVHFDLDNRATKAVPASDTKVAVGVLRYDVKLDSKEANAAAAIIHGFVDLDKIPAAPTAAQRESLPHVTFLR